jgi:fluoride exporter
MSTLAIVALSGGAGAVTRYLVTYWMLVKVEARWPGPPHRADWGTHAVNLSGSFAIGILLGGGVNAVSDDLPRHVMATGFLGAYTTFSTWMYDCWRLWEEGGRWVPVLNAFGALLAGIAAAALGFALGGAMG